MSGTKAQGALVCFPALSLRWSGQLTALKHRNSRDPLPLDLLRTHPNLCSLQIADALPKNY
jgi:hypothetical protein